MALAVCKKCDLHWLARKDEPCPRCERNALIAVASAMSERDALLEAAVEACRATTETLASMIVNGADGDWFDAVLIEQERKRGAEALSRIDALEKK